MPYQFIVFFPGYPVGRGVQIPGVRVIHPSTVGQGVAALGIRWRSVNRMYNGVGRYRPNKSFHFLRIPSFSFCPTFCLDFILIGSYLHPVCDVLKCNALNP